MKHKAKNGITDGEMIVHIQELLVSQTVQTVEIGWRICTHIAWQNKWEQ